jgi:hypothetical protein
VHIKRIEYTDNKQRLLTYINKNSNILTGNNIYTIYHIALKNKNINTNYGIYANGLLVETTSQRYLIELSNMEIVKNEIM